MKYKGLYIPEIHLDKLELKVSEYEDDACVVGSTTDEEVGCADNGTYDCDDCIFHRDNIYKSIDYLIEKGYVTKEEALTFELDK